MLLKEQKKKKKTHTGATPRLRKLSELLIKTSQLAGRAQPEPWFRLDGSRIREQRAERRRALMFCQVFQHGGASTFA